MKAAEILRVPYTEFMDREDKGFLMERAFTYEKGVDNGEYAKQCSSMYKKMAKERAENLKLG